MYEKIFEMNNKEYALFKNACIEAEQKNKNELDIGETKIQLKTAKQLLESIENQRKQKGLRIYNPKIHDKTHQCPDGIIYNWTSRTDNPKVCPRCKCRIDYKK